MAISPGCQRLCSIRRCNTPLQAERALPFSECHGEEKRALKNLSSGIEFEVPIAVIVLARMGIGTTAQLKPWHGDFFVCAFVVSAVVTPNDVISQRAFAILMCTLNGVGINAAQPFYQAHQSAGQRYRSARQIGRLSHHWGRPSIKGAPVRSTLAASIKSCASRPFSRADGAQRRPPARPQASAPTKPGRAPRRCAG